MKTFFEGMWQDTQGQDLVEYALMAGMVAVTAVAGMPALTDVLNTIFSRVASVVVAPTYGPIAAT